MRYILSRPSKQILARLARERALCAFDFDGTLSRIASHPEQAVVRARTRKLLVRLAELYPCVVVSGRARADVLEKLSGVKLARVIGNHGAETEVVSRKSRRLVERWKTALGAELPDVPGVWVEDKGLSLSVHFRQSQRKAEARRRILDAVGHLDRVHAFGGKQVVNLAPEGSPNKGDALAGERERLGCRLVLYVGDDDNDESAFALSGDVIPVRIGRKRKSNARYYLRSQAEIDELLEYLVLHAPEPSTHQTSAGQLQSGRS